MRTKLHIVYAPSCGYSIQNDTGKRFRLESEAEQFVTRLRRSGHCAWAETEDAREALRVHAGIRLP
jgi:hypothetical protein